MGNSVDNNQKLKEIKEEKTGEFRCRTSGARPIGSYRGGEPAISSWEGRRGATETNRGGESEGLRRAEEEAAARAEAERLQLLADEACARTKQAEQEHIAAEEAERLAKQKEEEERQSKIQEEERLREEEAEKLRQKQNKFFAN